MDLFSNGEPSNLLPHDGVVLYYGKVLSAAEADRCFDTLLHTLEWRHDEAVILGKHFITPRKVAWYADKDFPYSYSGTTKQALRWTEELLALKAITERVTQHTYNSCLANLYHTGEEGMAWHSDAERALGKNAVIASFSFGAERKFAFRHKRSKETTSLVLEHGSLLVMKGETQQNWLHRLPPTTKVKRARISLTFRTILEKIEN